MNNLPTNRQRFFSIIIPAHNEEFYIEETLRHLVLMDYPREFFEVIVVENGSSDNTYTLANTFADAQTHIFTIPRKGVSVAKNFGITKLHPESEWTIFLDADTLLEKDFLHDLNDFLMKDDNKNSVVGTTEVQPSAKSIAAKFWFTFYNLGHKLTKTSFALQIIKTSLLATIHFPEHLEMGEDLNLIVEARKQGNFFYFPTKRVVTSVRRFEQEGWWKVFIHWNFVALLPQSVQKFFHYKVVR